MTDRQTKLAGELTKAVNQYISSYSEYGPYANITIDPQSLKVGLIKTEEKTGDVKLDYVPAMELTVLANPSTGLMEADPNQIKALASQY